MASPVAFAKLLSWVCAIPEYIEALLSALATAARISADNALESPAGVQRILSLFNFLSMS